MFVKSIAFTLNYHYPSEFSGNYRIGVFRYYNCHQSIEPNPKFFYLGLKKNNSDWTWISGQELNSKNDHFWCSGQDLGDQSLQHAQLWARAGFCMDAISAGNVAHLICEVEGTRILILHLSKSHLPSSNLQFVPMTDQFQRMGTKFNKVLGKYVCSYSLACHM